MDLEEFNEVPDLPNTHILDNRIYTNQEIFKDEQTDIFKNTWLFVCHESELRNAGSFRTTSAGGKPIIVVKGNDGLIRSFYNICRHRSSPVV
ncbi:MAG: Rieske 2Fe-2S domain-containing protein, partial [Alphaproteobacteria bacterium]